MAIRALMLRSVVLLFLLLSIRQCDAIWCFSCHSNIDPACGDDFSISTSDSQTRTQCSGSCLKRRGARTDGVRRIEVERLCHLHLSDGCFSEYVHELEHYTCVCNSNFCNTSSRISASLSWMLVSVVAVFTLGCTYLWTY